MNGKVQFVINPTSGRSSGPGATAAFRRNLQRRGYRVETYVTRGPRDARRFAESLRDHLSAVVVVGGDGTISEVAGGLMDHPIPIWVLPTGTENLLATQMGYGFDADAMIDALEAGRVGRCDLALADDRPWLMVAGCGFDAEVVRRVCAARRGHITFANYIWPIWRTLWGYRFPAIRAVVDGQEVFEGRGLVFVGNMPRYAIGLELLQKARCDDGLLDVCIFPCDNVASLLAHFGLAVARLHLTAGLARYYHCRSLTVESGAAVYCQVDGDPAGRLPVAFCVLPDRVRLILPSRATRLFAKAKDAP